MSAMEVVAGVPKLAGLRVVRSREAWINGLLVAAAVLYGGAAVFFMATPTTGALAWWLLGTVVGLVVLGFLVVALPAHSTLPASGHHQLPGDPWAEEWARLMKRTVC